MSCTLLASVVLGLLIIFPHYILNDTTFGNKVIQYKICVLIFSANFGGNILVLRRTQWDIIINLHTALWKVAVILVRFYWNFIISDRFKKNAKNAQIWNLVKLRPIAAIEYILLEKTKHPPFNQYSIRLSTDPKSQSCVHNSGTAPILRKMDHCHILLHISFWSIPTLFYMTCPTMVFWPEIWMGNLNLVYIYIYIYIYIYHKRRTFLPPWFCTIINSKCTYYDAHRYVIFLSFPLYPQT